MTVTEIETLKGKIEYSFQGQGKPILFIHGGHVNCRETIFQKGIDSEAFCFITPSRPGYGRTPLTDQNKTPKGTADLIIALLDELKFNKITVIGISAGGLTALEIAANYPNRIESLVLLSALTKKWLVETDKVYKGGKKLFAPGMEQFTWLLYRTLFSLLPQIMARLMFKELSTYRPIKFTKEELQELKQITVNMRSGEGFANDLDQTVEQEILAKIECPTLILHSNYDNKVGISHPLTAKDKIKNSKLVTYNNRWGHMLWFGSGYEPILNDLKQYICK